MSTRPIHRLNQVTHTANRSPAELARVSASIRTARDALLEPLKPVSRAIMELRFNHAGTDLCLALTSLYGQRPGFSYFLQRLMHTVAEQISARPSSLCELDLEREDRPDWFLHDRLLGYSAYVDRFGGTLNGIRERSDYLRSLGVNYLHLLPFLRMRPGENDGGFAVENFTEIEPRLGTMADLRALCTDLRQHRISLCADFVLNHVADSHPWARAAASGDEDYRARFMIYPDREQPDNYDRTAIEVFPQTVPGNFTRHDEVDGWVWTTFYPYQWDLNYANPHVFLDITKALLYLANAGVEVFRLDSAPFLWKRVGTSCVNQPEVHMILKALRAIVDLAAPAVLLKAEAIVPTHDLPPYLGGGEHPGRECHLAYHSSLMASAWASLAEDNAELVREVLCSTPSVPANTGWVSYVRCHDEIVWNLLGPDMEQLGADFSKRIRRIANRLEGHGVDAFGQGMPFQSGTDGSVRGSNGMTAALTGFQHASNAADRNAALQRFRLLYGLCFTIGAVPLIFMGDEFLLGNNESPADASRCKADGRWLQRPRFDPSRCAQTGFPDSALAQAFNWLRGMAEQRRQLAGLDPLAPIHLLDCEDPAVLLLQRGELFLAIMNFSGHPVTLHPPAWSCTALAEGSWIDVLAPVSGHPPLDPTAATITLAPWAMHWLHRQP